MPDSAHVSRSRLCRKHSFCGSTFDRLEETPVRQRMSAIQPGTTLDIFKRPDESRHGFEQESTQADLDWLSARCRITVALPARDVIRLLRIRFKDRFFSSLLRENHQRDGIPISHHDALPHRLRIRYFIPARARSIFDGDQSFGFKSLTWAQKPKPQLRAELVEAMAKVIVCGRADD